MEDRFSKHPTELGHVTMVPFVSSLKMTPKQLNNGRIATRRFWLRRYRSKLIGCSRLVFCVDRTRIGPRRWWSWRMPMEKKRLTWNYKRVNQHSVIPDLPLPTVADLLAGLGGATVFSTMDSISGFFQGAIKHPDSIPVTAVCTTFGNYEWTRCPMGLASSPGWF